MNPMLDEPAPLAARLRAQLEVQRAADLYRVRRVIDGGHGVEITVNGRRSLNFCSNDYLGLACDPRVAEAARVALTQGTGSGASALISGYNREHRALEEELAAFLQRPRALLFSSGWAANLGVLRGLLGRDDLIVADELNHASLIDGGRLAGAEYCRVAHADVSAYEQALGNRESGAVGGRAFGSAGGASEHTEGARQSSKHRVKLLVTDSVFSMDGDLAPLAELAALAKRERTALMIDDAHGFGVLGAGGRGAWEQAVPIPDSRFPIPDIYVATLGKSLGAAGAFVAGDDDLIEFLVQRARSWVFSTAPPPAIAAAARRALRIVQDEPERRAQLVANIERFRAGARALGIPLLSEDATVATPIQPLLLGDAARALALSQFLFERGCWVAAIRPPTVPKNTSRLRITFSAAHTPAQIDTLLAALADGWKQLGPANANGVAGMSSEA